MAFVELWGFVAPTDTTPVPAVDFSTSTVIAASMGARGSSGYEIQVLDVFRDGTKLYVVVEEMTASGRCVVGAVVTWPLTVAEVFDVRGRVVFVERRRILEC